MILLQLRAESWARKLSLCQELLDILAPRGDRAQVVAGVRLPVSTELPGFPGEGTAAGTAPLASGGG